MTLRYEDRIPVGLDWSICNDGSPHRPEVWKAAAAPAKPKDDGELAEPKPPKAESTNSRKRLSQAIEQKVIRLYRDELKSSKVVAGALGIQPATVFKVLARNNVPTRSRTEAMALRAPRG
jgi:hypothetical protein